ncbi:sugar phosphate isomerase/epimerase [Candidatus Bathyarchaeota archaeon]|nr:sugar phosphate isomerase/epimerase [Candidatus Bathyarchaeota archaeon]
MTKPEIGLSMLYYLNQPFTSVLNKLGKLDVKHVELVDEGLHTLNERRINKLNQLATIHNLDFIIHAPWAEVNVATPNSALRRAVLKRLEQSIIFAGQLDCKLWLFHPGSKTGLSQFYPGKDWQNNLNSVRKLLKVAKRECVNIALENTPEPPSLMKSVEDFHRFYQEFNDDIGMVLDVAHANINNQIGAFIKQFSEKIAHIHVSDNNGESDLHLGIGQGNINWKNFAKLVKQINYSNLIVIESITNIQESLNALRSIF